MESIYTELSNNSTPIEIEDIPVLDYKRFFDQTVNLLGEESSHCIAYFGIERKGKLQFFCFIANDLKKKIYGYSYLLEKNKRQLESLTPLIPAVHVYEREIFENYGIGFSGHPWLKPIRYPFYRHDDKKIIENYPFYKIESEELHEVGVGPVHAGIIEPGHFRFICNGERVLNLEIQLGFQHRGIEKLMTQDKTILQNCILSETIAGDTAIGHSLAFVQLMESLAGIDVNEKLEIERCIALELERIAIHIGDTAALCGDVAYQLGQVVCEALRTTIINTTQLWCGNRFGKGLIRPGGSNFALTNEVAETISRNISYTYQRYEEITDRIFSLTSLLARFEDTGSVTRNQAYLAGATGMAARSSGLERDIRKSHPFQYYKNYNIRVVLHEKGDVLSRALQRKKEIKESVDIIINLLKKWSEINSVISRPKYNAILRNEAISVSLTEGWRGEICHVAVTDSDGKLMHYKIKDPSLHNWMMLSLAVRNQEISDFPLCNKSFNLSYCGNDL